jgi:tryptophan synthase beta chain
MTGGKLAYDSGDVAMMTPLLYMYTLGHDFVPGHSCRRPALPRHGPDRFRPGARRYHHAQGSASDGVFRGRRPLCQDRGHHPAPETTHAIRGAIIEAMKDPKEPKTILFNFSGHGLIDMASYDNYFSGKLSDFTYPRDQIEASLARLPKVD